MTAQPAQERLAQLRASYNKIIVDFGAFLEGYARLKRAFIDVKRLPHSRDDILNALLVESVLTPDDKEAQQLRACTYFLMNILEGVGPEPLPELGFDLSEWPEMNDNSHQNRQRALETLRKMEADPRVERAAKFRELASANLKLIEAKVEIAMVIREAFKGSGDR